MKNKSLLLMASAVLIAGAFSSCVTTTTTAPDGTITKVTGPDSKTVETITAGVVVAIDSMPRATVDQESEK